MQAEYIFKKKAISVVDYCFIEWIGSSENVFLSQLVEKTAYNTLRR